MDEVETKIFDIIANEARIDRASVKSDATMEDLKIASVDLVQIVFAIEVEFDITIPEEALGLDVKNVDEVVVAVRKLVNESKAGSKAPGTA